MSKQRCEVKTCPNAACFCSYHSPMTCKRAHTQMTERQKEAWSEWQSALKSVLIIKARACSDSAESRGRWAELQKANAELASAQEELEASVIDDFDTDEERDPVNGQLASARAGGSENPCDHRGIGEPGCPVCDCRDKGFGSTGVR